MNGKRSDITQSIISTVDINDRIGSIFSNSAILDTQFNIISISLNIMGAMGYTRLDIQRRPVSIFNTAVDFRELLEYRLRPGYFEEQAFEMRCKNGDTIVYHISGFYMGLIADVNGLIVLKFRDADEMELINEELEAKTRDLDDFIYSSSHALRGPLATLKGLINLISITQDPKEIEFLAKQMNVFAERLDEKLHQLIYVAESDKNPIAALHHLSIKSIFESLSSSIAEASVDFPVRFSCPVVDREQLVENGELVLSMLNNMTLFFCQQPKAERNRLVFDALQNSCACEIMIRARGFSFNDTLVEKIKNVNFGYSEILNFPELLNYYAAKKIMLKLKGTIQFMLIASDEVVVLMTVPRDKQLPLF
ncbi:MAG TPA: hypothetical protein VIT44_06635 [Cyclobacteriaceae bacterium]